LEATDRSMLPVIMIKTIGNIMMPISMKSEEVRERFKGIQKIRCEAGIEDHHERD